MADYNFKGFTDYIKLLDPVQNQETSIQETEHPPAGQTDVVLSQEPTIARIVDLASYRR